MTWTLDPAHSSVTFSAKHMKVTTVRGSIKIRDFDLDLDLDNPERSSVRVSHDAASIDTCVRPTSSRPTSSRPSTSSARASCGSASTPAIFTAI